MDDLSDLELAGLVVSEVEIHLGVVDKNLADLIIAQRVASDTFEIFQQKMGSMAGVSLPVSLLKSVDRLLRMMHPSIKAKNTHAYHGPGTQRGVEQPHVRSQAYIEAQAQSRPSLPGQAANQAPVQDLINNPRKRGRSRSRSNSPNTQGNRRLRSNPSDYDRPRRTPYDADLDRLIMEDGERRGRQGRCEDDHSQREDEVPVLNNIYDGHVAGVKKFGAFVNLQIGIGNVTGLVLEPAVFQGIEQITEGLGQKERSRGC